MEVGWKIFVLVVGSAAMVAWYIHGIREEILGILMRVGERQQGLSHDIDRVVEHIDALERQLRAVEELQRAESGPGAWVH